jgi:hypothetical protein
MEVHFTPEQEARLAQIAANAGIDAERFVKDAVLRLIEGDFGSRAVPPGAVVGEMRALRARVKPDPRENWQPKPGTYPMARHLSLFTALKRKPPARRGNAG